MTTREQAALSAANPQMIACKQIALEIERSLQRLEKALNTGRCSREFADAIRPLFEEALALRRAADKRFADLLRIQKGAATQRERRIAKEERIALRLKYDAMI